MPDGYKTGELQPGMLIGGGKFALLRRIGEGGMGEVFEAEDTLIGRRVALKVLYPHLAENPSVLQRFRREARAAARIVHPHIVSVYEVGQRSNGSFYIVEELLVGRNLREHLQARGRLEVPAALDILTPIMVALVATHDKDIIHRDIKPENIFLTSSADGMVVPKLIDFGISKMDTGSLHLTQPGTVLGTPHYMSPEMASASPATVHADLWSIGVVLFEMLVGRTPFDGSSIEELLASILTARVPRVDALVPILPREMGDIVQRALDRDPDRRFGSMRDFLRVVLAFAEQHEPSSVARHAGIVGTAGLKSRPPPPEPDVRLMNIRIEPFDGDTADLLGVLGDETLDVEPQASIRRPVWPIARMEAPWYRPKRSESELEQHADAAQHALRLNALHDAVDRAEQAIVRHGATGETRGEMRLVQAIAFRWLGDFAEAERCAAEAMALLPRTSSGWFAAVAHRGMANGYLGRNDEVERLAKEVLSLEIRDWNGHQVATLCYLTIWLVRGSALELAQKTFTRAHGMIRQQRAFEPVEPAVRAAFDLAKAELALHAGDPTTYLRRVERALGQFALIGDARSACLQRANIGNAYMQLGAYAQAERLLQEAITVGEPMKLMFIAPVRANLGFTLARLGRLEEALLVESAALDECVQQGYRRFEAVSRTYLAEILSLRGDLPGAEAEARAATEVASISPAIGAHARAVLASILLQRGLVWDAFEQAKRAVDTLEQLDGVEEGEALIRVVYVMALDATARPRSAAERLAGAQKRLLDRMDRILDPELQKCFRENVPEHALTFEYNPKVP